MLADILVVDHQPGARAVLRAILETRGFHVREATGGVEALSEIARRSYTLVITEMCMPELDGIELLLHARTLRPDQKIVTICGSEQFPSAVLLRDSELLGAAGVLSRPFEPEALLDLVHQALGTTPTPSNAP